MKPKPIKTVATADEARQLAIDWRHWMNDKNLSYGELNEWQGYFDQLARKFPGLTEEFKENGII
jgi:hypothetical protein